MAHSFRGFNSWSLGPVGFEENVIVLEVCDGGLREPWRPNVTFKGATSDSLLSGRPWCLHHLPQVAPPTMDQQLNMGTLVGTGHIQMVTFFIPFLTLSSQIVWHFGGWSAWAPSPPLPVPIWPWAQATWHWPSAWPPAHLLWLQLLGWHTDQRSQPCPPSVLFLGQNRQFDETVLGRGGRRWLVRT